MPKSRRSFFERLTGSVNLDEYEDEYENEEMEYEDAPEAPELAPAASHMPEDSGDGQLTVDVYQTPEDIILKTIVAGVKPTELDISITRDMVTIRGEREDSTEAADEDYFYKELYWGSFSRTVLLPQEIEVEEAEASEKHGLLTIRLPKVDKEKQTKLKVKTA